jgi:hypothetical protein
VRSTLHTSGPIRDEIQVSTNLTRLGSFRRSSGVGPWPENDSCENNRQAVDAIEHAVLSEVESPLTWVAGTLANLEPRVGSEGVSNNVDELLSEQPPIASPECEELLFGRFEEFVGVRGQDSPARLITTRPGVLFSVRQRRSISR